MECSRPGAMGNKILLNTEARSILQRVAGLFRRQSAALGLATAYNETRGKDLATHLEVADNGATRRKGLLGRDGLDAGTGLWIYPCESVHTFAMRFAIDLVYLDRHDVVRKVRSSVPPGRLSMCLSARSVIELPAGTVEATGTRAGDKISIQILQDG